MSLSLLQLESESLRSDLNLSRSFRLKDFGNLICETLVKSFLKNLAFYLLDESLD